MNARRTLRVDHSFADWEGLLALIRYSFAYMDRRIDPPSSAVGLTVDALRQKADAEIAFVVIEDETLVGCMFCRPEPDCLYVGKLAVLPDRQGKGLGRHLLALAEATARDQGLQALRLETRIELTENHAAFTACGFVKTAENAHPGFDRTTSIEMRKQLVT